MVEQPGLAGLAVVGGDEQQPVGAELGRLAGQLDRVRGDVGADARDDRGAVADRVADDAQDLAVLGRGGRGRLARGPADDDAVVAVVDQVGRDRRGLLQVDRAVVAEGRGHGGEHPAEGCLRGSSGGHAGQGIR